MRVFSGLLLISMVNIVKKCHVLSDMYLRNFSDSNWKVYVSRLTWNNFEQPRLEETKNIGVISHLYNYKWNNWVDNEYENYFAWREGDLSKKILRALNVIDITLQIPWSFLLNIEHKNNILALCLMLYEKVIYSFAHKYYHKERIINIIDYLALRFYVLDLKILVWTLLKLLLGNGFKRWIICDKNEGIFISDCPMHFHISKWDNNIKSFLENIWSNFIFPLSKKYLLVIERPIDTHGKNIFIQIDSKLLSHEDDDISNETIKNAVINRPIVNASKYVAWSNKQILQKAISEQVIYNQLYPKDPIVFNFGEWMEERMKKYSMLWNEICTTNNVDEDFIKERLDYLNKINTLFDQFFDKNILVLDYLSWLLQKNKSDIVKNLHEEWISKIMELLLNNDEHIDYIEQFKENLN